MASAPASTCDVAVYEQGVWFLRLSAVLLLASFANYAALPSKDKAVKAAAVAQVEEIQEAVAMPASEQSSVRQGTDVSVPPVPDTRAPKTQLRSGKAIRSGRRAKDTRKKNLQPARRGVVRKRRRAASQGKPKTTSTGVVFGSNNFLRARQPQASVAAAASAAGRVCQGNVPLTLRQSRIPASAHRVADKPPRSTSSAQEPITISMSPSKIKRLQFSL